MTIDDALTRFLVQLEADGRSPHTTGQYRRHVRLFGAWWRDVGPGGTVGAITHEDIAWFFGCGTGARKTITIARPFFARTTSNR